MQLTDADTFFGEELAYQVVENRSRNLLINHVQHFYTLVLELYHGCVAYKSRDTHHVFHLIAVETTPCGDHQLVVFAHLCLVCHDRFTATFGNELIECGGCRQRS